MLSQTPTARFRGDVSRHVGNIRAVTLDGRAVRVNHIPPAADAVQELIDYTFGKTSHELQLITDRKMYVLTDDALNSFDDIKNPHCQSGRSIPQDE